MDRQPARWYGRAGPGLLCLLHPGALAGMPPDRGVAAGMSIVWLIRRVAQFVRLRIRHPLAHAPTALFACGLVLFAWPLLRPLARRSFNPSRSLRPPVPGAARVPAAASLPPSADARR